MSRKNPSVPTRAEPSSARLVATLGLAGLLSGLVIVTVYQTTLPAITAYKAKVLREAVGCCQARPGYSGWSIGAAG